MRIIGITGGIGCGKSHVLKKLKTLGAFVLDSDKLVFELNKKGEPLYCAIVKEFGNEILQQNGELDKAKLRGIVFSSEEELKRLNRASVTVLRQEIERIIKNIRGYDFCFIEGVRVFEDGFFDLFDGVWYITCGKEEQLKRLMARDGILKDQALAIIESQSRLEESISRADAVINTDGTVLETEKIVEELYNKLKTEMKNGRIK